MAFDVGHPIGVYVVQIKARHILAIILVAWSPWFYGAIVDWNTATFEASPASGDSISQGDDRIRELKENLSARLAPELLFGDRFAGGDTGKLREGAARAFYNTACPTTLSNSATDRAGEANLVAADDGRLCVDSDDNTLSVWNGSAWEQALNTLTGTINLLSTPRFATTAGADAFNPLAFHIRDILVDDSQDAGCLTGGVFQETDLGGQVFGDAGVACYSIGTASIDFSTRSTTSRAMVIATVAFNDDAESVGCGIAIYRDSIANQVGGISMVSTDTGDTDNIITNTVIEYVTGLTAATHEFAVHVSNYDAGGGSSDCVPVASPDDGQLIFIDLGPEY